MNWVIFSIYFLSAGQSNTKFDQEQSAGILRVSWAAPKPLMALE